jgi:dTDP-4-dehydrorhamnose 3,5-epimerase
MSSSELPDGVELFDLTAHRDERGVFTELFREEWGSAVHPVQWNVVHSRAGVLRGVHVHPRHADYLMLAAGRMTLGLCDLRPESPTHLRAAAVELSADAPRALSIPPGVAHGFHFGADSIHIYAVSHYWDPADELGCRWDDPGLGIPWTHETAQISRRDADLPGLPELVAELATARRA